MGERVSHSSARKVWTELLLRGRQRSAALNEVLRLNRLVQVIGTSDSSISNVFCT